MKPPLLDGLARTAGGVECFRAWIVHNERVFGKLAGAVEVSNVRIIPKWYESMDLLAGIRLYRDHMWKIFHV